MKAIETIVRSSMPSRLKNAATAGRVLLYTDPARILAHLVYMVGNFGFVFLALHLMTKTMASIVPTGAKEGLTGKPVPWRSGP
jgi:hypothetical protein